MSDQESSECHVVNGDTPHPNANGMEPSKSASESNVPAETNHTIDDLLDSEEFKFELHRLVESQIRAGVKPANALQQLTELLTSNRGFPANGNNSNSSDTLPPKNGTSATNTGLSKSGTIHYDSRSPHRRGNASIIPINDLRNEDRRNISSEEKSLRCKLAALYRLVDMHGWTHGIYNHITVRLKPNENAFLINPFGLLYHEISASNLVKIDSDGNLLEKGISHLGVNKAGWLLHSAIHEGRSDVHCIIHLHLPDVVAVSCMKSGLLPVSIEAEQLLSISAEEPDKETEHNGARGLVRYHAYRGVLVDASEKASLIHDLGKTGKVLFLRNHGVAICGRNIEEAWQLTRLVVTACQAQTRLVHLGGLKTLQELSTPHPRGQVSKFPDFSGIVVASNEVSNREENRQKAALLEFEAMMRLLDNAGYRTGYNYHQPLLMHRVLGSLTEAAVDSLGGDEALLNSPLLSHTQYDYDEKQAQSNALRIKQLVATNREKATQRNQWLSQSLSNGRKALSHDAIAEDRENVVESKQVTVQQSTPISGKNSHLRIQSPGDNRMSGGSEPDSRCNTLKSDPGSPDERLEHKKGLKIAGFRIPSFSKKKK